MVFFFVHEPVIEPLRQHAGYNTHQYDQKRPELKFQMPNRLAGRSAIATSCMILPVVMLSRTWGLDDT